ncbi:hypothetical protein E6H16_00945 [Candidatus Bathyarchaeota archaeon]|nr:MAG: hypothetical protein E6H16_00945 [Candidatus Bathyarchaeota archaeon]
MTGLDGWERSLVLASLMLVIGHTLFIVSYPQYRPIGFLGLIVSAPLIGWARWILARREIGHS